MMTKPTCVTSTSGVSSDAVTAVVVAVLTTAAVVPARVVVAGGDVCDTYIIHLPVY